MMKGALLILAAAAVSVTLTVLAGCGHPLIPPGALRTAHPVTMPHAGPPPQLGVDLYAASGERTGTAQAEGLRDLGYIKRKLGAQAVSLTWNFYSPGVTSPDVTATRITLSPAAVTTITRMARTDGLAVVYRPLIRVGPSWKWEGFLNPPQQAAWFNSLYKAELPYLKAAQRLGVSEFVVATELRALNSSTLWPAFLARAARVFHGTISYASYQGNYTGPRKHLLPVSEYGTDAYPRIRLPATATVRQLAAAWEAQFAGQAPAVLARTQFDEIGIQASRDAYRNPADWDISEGPLDQKVQANWFSAACHVVAHFGMRGIFFWNVNLADDPGAPPYPSPPTFEGKKGAAAIHGCLRIFREGH